MRRLLALLLLALPAFAQSKFSLPDQVRPSGASITGAAGDTFYASSATQFARLSIGSNGKFLRVASGLPAWGDAAFSDLTGSVACSQEPAHTGDATSSAGSCALTLASLISAGSCGDTTHSCGLTFDVKGRVTAYTNNTISVPPTPTGTGFRHVTSGVEDGAAVAVTLSTSDVTGTLGVGNGGTGTATAFTLGSAVFAGSSGVYSQDNAHYFYDATNHRLGLGTTSPSTRLHVFSDVDDTSNLTAGTVALAVTDSTNGGNTWTALNVSADVDDGGAQGETLIGLAATATATNVQTAYGVKATCTGSGYANDCYGVYATSPDYGIQGGDGTGLIGVSGNGTICGICGTGVGASSLGAYFGGSGRGVQIQQASITPGSLTNDANGNMLAGTFKATWTNASITGCGNVFSCDITVATLPAHTRVENVYMIVTGQAAGVTTLTGAIGRTGTTYIDYIVASDLKAAANTVYGDALAERGTNLTGYDMASYTGTTAVKWHLISTGTALNTVTGSTGVIYIETTVLP